MWNEESILKKELSHQQETMVNSRGVLLIDAEYEPLSPREERTPMSLINPNDAGGTTTSGCKVHKRMYTCELEISDMNSGVEEKVSSQLVFCFLNIPMYTCDQ